MTLPGVCPALDRPSPRQDYAETNVPASADRGRVASAPLPGAGGSRRHTQQPAQFITLALGQRAEAVHHPRDPLPVIVGELILILGINAGREAFRRVPARTAGRAPVCLWRAGTPCHTSPVRA